jgi:hypothetical protein
MKINPLKEMSIEELNEHIENYDGFCKNCLEWTRQGDTEPDARGYNCPQCGQDSVIGAEEILIDYL